MELSKDLYFRIALSFAHGIGGKNIHQLIKAFGSAEAVIKAPLKSLLNIDGIGAARAKAIKDNSLLTQADKECKFIDHQGVRCLTPEHADYPSRLLQCDDAPHLLYYKGTASLNNEKCIAIVGTRLNTNYGQRVTEELVESLSKVYKVLVVSGLAFGVDAIAHKASIKNEVSTIGVLAHGLHTVYPAEHKKLAIEIIDKGGGLLTEFSSVSKFDRGNFLSRNRIVAGMCDATIVVESDIKGGALITAMLAHSYNREVCAFPGRATDHKSAGTNMLIKNNIAGLITNAEDFIQYMNWQSLKQKTSKKSAQPELFMHLNTEEQRIIDILHQHESLHTDELQHLSTLSQSEIAITLLNLEMKCLIEALPGKRFKIY